MAVFNIFCKEGNCDAQMISGTRGHSQRPTANAATASAAWPWQVAGEMLKWMTDGKALKPVIPIAVGENSIAFPRCSVKAGIDSRWPSDIRPGLASEFRVSLPGYIISNSA